MEKQPAETPSEAHPPALQPEDFGLTAQEADSLKQLTNRDHVSEKIEFASFAVFIPITILIISYFIGWEHWGVALLLGFFVGGWASMMFTQVVTTMVNWLHTRTARNLPNYPNYLRYEEACKKHSIYLDALESARQRVETQRVIARQEEVRKEIPRWKGLDGKSFESDLVKLFKQRGYDVRWTGYAGADEGVDILLKANGKKIIVQCKAYRNYVAPAVVRELYGTLIHQEADEAWLVTTSGFYNGCISFARGKPIRLLTIRQILEGREFADTDKQ